MDIHEILKQLPHRYPFLLVDRVLELEKGKRIKAIKNVTINEPFFVGHFPHRPVMPGVLMLEALAQAAAFGSLGAAACLGGACTGVSRSCKGGTFMFCTLSIRNLAVVRDSCAVTSASESPAS